VSGIGEIVHPLPHREIWQGEVLISVPSASVPTAPFYQHFRQQHPTLGAGRDEVMERFARNAAESFSPSLIENDFESDICSFCPAVGKALEGAREVFPGTTSITGSGAAIFSLVPAQFADRVPDYLLQAAQENITVHRTTLFG
jgi:4-diphosphocytidyl-2C-methyl-D-erythritol kinase